MVLTIAMLLTLVVVPASAAGPQVSVALTADKTTVQRSSSDQEILITVTLNNPAAETDRPTAIGFDLKSANENVVLAEKATNRAKLAYSYVNDDDDTITGTANATYKTVAAEKKGIFTFLYGDVTKTLPIKESSLELMTIKATIKANAPVGEYTISTEKMTIADTGDVGVIAKTIYDTNQTLTVTVVEALTGSLPVTITAPAKGGTPETTITGTNYTGSITWTPAVTGGTFAANTEYTAKVELTANTGYQFADGVNPTVAGADSVADVNVKDSGSKLEFKATFPETDSFPPASVTAPPTAKSGLKYDGTEQGLLGFVGTATGGAMQYSLDNSSWSDAIPTGKNAGDYTVYYKVVGDSTHSDSVVAHISAKIDPKEISGVTIVSIADQPYTGSAITPDPVVTDGTATLEKDKDYTVSCAKNTYVGTADLTITGTGNYTETKGATFTITAVDQNPTFTTPKDLAKGGAMLDLRTLVHGAKGDAMTFTITSGTAANLSGHTLTSTGITGTVTIKVSITAKDVNGDSINEYNAFSKDDAITVNVIDKTTPSYDTEPIANTGLKYDGTDQALVTEGTTNHGTVKYSLDGTNWTDTVPTGKNANTYNVQYKIVGDSTHTDSTPKTHTVTIDPREVTVSGITAENKAYDGGTDATVNAAGATFTGMVAGDNLTISPTGTFADADVGNGKTVTLTLGTLGGTSAGNYKRAATGNQATTTADITAKEVTLTGGINATDRSYVKDNKTVDLTKGTLTFTGLVSGETLDVNIPATGMINDADAGNGKTVTYSGVTLKDGTTGKASNYTLNATLPTVTVNITKESAPTLTDITLNQRYTVTTEQSKDIGTAGMPDDAGTLTYAKGTESKTGSVAIDSWNVDATTGKVTYKLSGGKANDTVTLPVIIGSTNYADATANVKITLVRGSSGGGSSAAVAPDMPLLRYGSRGEAVKTLQEKLNAKGYNSGNVDGIFGTKTRAAVISFQKATGLGVDGIVGKLTWAKLYDAAPVSVVAPATTAQPMLRSGSRGDAVRKLQELLNARGHNCGAVDGIFGVKTRAAVIAFQKANGLSADGIVGPLTWGKLI